jgi:probable F420-dependent oxidoreductase
VQVGVLVRNFGGFPETGRNARACVDVALLAEQAGFDSVWVTDHIVLPASRDARYPHNDSGEFPYQWHEDIYEPLTLMAALAQATTRVALGVAVLVIPYRHPLTTAKMLATIDQLANGRVLLGAGVGWLRDEFDALGLPPETFEHRGSVTEDYLRAMRSAWTGTGPATYEGRFVHYRDQGTFPHPVQSTIPIWIGGKGDQALRRAARLGDGYLAIASTPSMLANEVRRYRDEGGAGTVGLIDGIVITDHDLPADRAALSGTPSQIAEGLAAFEQAGLQHLVAGVRFARGATFADTAIALERVAGEVLSR